MQKTAGSRVSLHCFAEIPAPADQVWDLIREARRQGGLPGAELIGCELMGTPESVPRTRRMRFVDGATIDETVRLPER